MAIRGTHFVVCPFMHVRIEHNLRQGFYVMKRVGCWVVVVFSVVFLSNCAPAPRRSTMDVSPSVFQAPPAPDAESMFKQAEQAYKAKDFGSAVAGWERVAQAYPNNAVAARALQRLGNVSLEQGRADQALKYFDYLLYMYPQWEGIPLARVDRLRALSAKGEKREVLKEGQDLWKASQQNPEAHLPLSLLLASAYRGTGDAPTAFEWLSYASTKAQSPEEKDAVARTALDLIGNLDGGAINKLKSRNMTEFVLIFLDYRLAQIEKEKGRADQARQLLTDLLNRSATHPMASEIRKALGQTPVAASTLPVNPDRVGCLMPLSGQYESYGNMALRGVKLAYEEWNQEHPEQQFTLIVKDAQDGPETASRELQSLGKENGVLATVGLLSKQVLEGVSTDVSQLGIPLLTMTQKEDSAPNPYIFHMFLDKEMMIAPLVRHCRERLGYNNFAVLYPKTRYGESMRSAFEKVVKERGGNLAASASYDANASKDATLFKDSIQKLITAGQQSSPGLSPNTVPFDALFIPDDAQTVALIAPQLPYYNLVGVTLLGTNLWAESPPINEVGGVYVEKALFSTPFYAQNPAPNVQKFVEKFRNTYQTTPSYLEAQAYDALKVLLTARGRTTRSQEMRSAFMQNLLQTKNYDGVTGTVSFTPAGDVERSYYLLQVQNGSIAPLGR